MRRLRVRSLLVVALVTVCNVSWVAFVVARIAETRSLRLQLGEGEPSSASIWIAVLAGILLAAAFIGFGLRKWIVQPLEAMGRSARSIAEGDMDVSLPDSRIREISDVREGFEKMVAGLRQSLADREALEEERRFFIGAIAHDLRTPLFALRGYLEGLDQGIAASPEQKKRYISVCIDKAGQLDRLVSDLFAFAKAEYPETVRTGDVLDLAAEVRRAVDGMRGPAEAKGVSVAVEAQGESIVSEAKGVTGAAEVQGGSIAVEAKSGSAGTEAMSVSIATEASEFLSCFVRGDAHQLARAIGNLLDNAVRHTPPQGRIVARCGTGGGRVEVTVSDTGTGFAPADLARVFEPLYRGESSRSRDTGGAGLGLAIARRIFRAHGGDLTAANRPEGGAELRGWIPGIRA